MPQRPLRLTRRQRGMLAQLNPEQIGAINVLLRPVVNGALAACIHAHGPITTTYISSAQKRITAGISSVLKSIRADEDFSAVRQTRSTRG